MAYPWKRYTIRDCPICNGARNDCRENTENNFIHCRDSQANPFQYKFLGLDALGFGMWKHQDDIDRESEDRRREWQAQRELERKAKEQQLKEKYAKALSSEERDRGYRDILGQLTLSKRHRQELRKRGLTDEQIDAGGFRTVHQWQPLTREVNPNIPGVGKYGDRLIIPTDGILCPIQNEQGQYTGYQVRSDTAYHNSKYIWAASERKRENRPTVHLKNGELPLSYFGGSEPKITLPSGITNPLALTEGTHIKPYICAIITGLTTIGAAGGNFTTSKQQLKDYVKFTNADALILFADSASVKNGNVTRNYERLFELAKELNLPVYVAWWGQFSKADGDIDEISEEKLKAIAYLNPDEFFGIARKEQVQKRIIETQKKLHGFTSKIDFDFDSKYFPNLDELIPDYYSGIINLIAAKGTGKSYQIHRLIDKFNAIGFNIVSLTPRINLGREQCQRWKLEFLNDVCRQYKQPCADNVNLGLCWDSLYRLAFRAEDEKLCLVLDEAELGLMHLLTSGTCKENRPQLLRVFENIIQKIVANDGIIILSDADLTDVSVNCIQALANHKLPTLTFKNSAKPEPWDVQMFREKGELLSEIMVMIAAGEKMAIAIDNQQEAEALEKVITEHPDAEGKKIIRVDRTTTEDDFYRRFVTEPNKSINEEQPDILIYTPSMGVGVSIDVKPYFNKVFGLFYGNIPPSQCRQMLARVRDAVPRLIWAVERGHTYSDELSFFPEAIKKRLFSLNKTTSVDILDLARALAGDDADDGQILETFNRLWNPETKTWDNPYLDATCQILARNNYGLSQLYVQLWAELEDEGHIVYEPITEPQFGLEGRVKGAKQEIREGLAGKIANAEDIPLQLANTLQKKPVITEEERFKITKAFLKSELPEVDLTTELVLRIIQDNRKWLNQVKFSWYVTNLEKTKEIDISHWQHKLNQFSSGVSFLPDIKTYSLAAQVLKDIGFWDLVEFNSDWRLESNDPRLEEFRKRCLKHKGRIYAAFGYRVSKKTQMVKFIGNLVKRFGLKLKSNQVRVGENRIKHYHIEGLSDGDRLTILEALDRRYEDLTPAQSVIQPPETQQHTTEKVNLSPVSNINPETQAEQCLDSVTGDGFSLKENLSPVTKKDTTNENFSTGEKETLSLSLVGGFDELRVGMDILIREFTTFGDWVKVKITELADGIVFYQQYDLAGNTGSFPWGAGEVAFN